MIPAPNRLGSAARSSTTSGPTPVAAGSAAPAAPDEPDSNLPSTQTPLDARIAALVARASTPEDEALEQQRQEFDYIAREQAETEREINVLRDMAMEQIKQDDELLKKWIALI